MAAEFDDPLPDLTPAQLKEKLLAEQPLIMDEEEFDEATVRRATLDQLREDPVLYVKYMRLHQEDLERARRENVIHIDGTFDMNPLEAVVNTPITKRSDASGYEMPMPKPDRSDELKELRAKFVHWHKGRKPRNRRNWFQ